MVRKEGVQKTDSLVHCAWGGGEREGKVANRRTITKYATRAGLTFCEWVEARVQSKFLCWQKG
jgi:hypothetical protein